ncbi:MAG: FIST C-terminal domain-containing protein [Alphaproteobacteria bacterium]
MKLTQHMWKPGTGLEGDAPITGPNDPSRDLVLYFAERALFESDAVAQLAGLFPGATLIGCSTGGQIHGRSLVDAPATLTHVRFERTLLASAAVDVDGAGGSWQAGRRLADRIHRDGLRAVFVLADGTKVNGSELIQGIRDVVGRNTVITGGLAGDGPRFERTFVGLGAKAQPGLVAAIGLCGPDLTIGVGSCGGWDAFGPERKITRAEANVLFELDGKPALDLYKRYLGEEADRLPGSALLFPLRVYPPGEPVSAIMRTVVGIDEARQAMIFAGDVPQGHSAQLMRGQFDRLIEGAGTAGEQIGAFGRERLAILVSCIGRRLLMGQRVIEEIEAASEALGPATRLTGFYSYGEICPHDATGFCELHNQTMTITAIAEG